MPYQKGMPSRDATVLIDLMLCTTQACFTSFFDLLWSLLYLKIPKFLVHLFVNFFWIIMIIIMNKNTE